MIASYAAVREATKHQTRLSDWTTTTISASISAFQKEPQFYSVDHPTPHDSEEVDIPSSKDNQDPSAAAAAKSPQSCPTLCDPIDGSPPGSSVHGIFQARTLEWVAIAFSNAWKWKVKVKLLSRVWLLATPWTTAHQAPQSMGFSRQEYWRVVPLPSPRIPLYQCNWHVRYVRCNSASLACGPAKKREAFC